ncbi:hypothetical protein GCM10027569_72280 [Flindersiella endophytica]
MTGAVTGVIGAVSGLTAVFIAIPATKAARRSADEAAATAQLERDQRHDDLRPTPPAEIKGDVETNSEDGGGRSALMGSVVLPRDFRVRATAIMGPNASAPIGMPLVIRANQPQSFEIEHWPDDKTHPTVKEIRFRFWSPVEGDGVEPWSCQCGRPSDDGESAPGHWEWTVPVSYYDVRASIW